MVDEQCQPSMEERMKAMQAELTALKRRHNWSGWKRAGFWIKYVIGPTIVGLTALSTCGLSRVMGVQTVEAAKVEHEALEGEIDKAEERIATAQAERDAALGKRLDELTASMRDVHNILMGGRKK